MKELIHYPVPQWITYFVVAGFCYIVFAMAQLAQKGHSKAFWPVVLFFVAYIGYVYLGSSLDWFNVVSFPPRVLRVTTIPFIVLLFVVLPRFTFFREMVANWELHQLIRVHHFRVVGSTFLLLAFHKALPTPFAWIAGVGDVITAITSFYVANQVQKRAPNGIRWAYLWNTFGFLDIIFTAFMANYLTRVSMLTGSMGVDSLVWWPFCLIPAIAPPLIWFLHTEIYKKLNNY
jgi:hypothetical protein